MNKPKLSLGQIINMSVGFLGIQFGFALQNGNASRVLQSFGADVEQLSWFWLAAPLTGMIIQPIIGFYSDRTWNGLGRRKPFFLTGAIIAATALLFFPHSGALAAYLPPVMVGAGILMMMDASFNVAMEPFRALVADNLPEEQSTLGFSVQTFLIGIGAVAGSWLPYIFANYLGFAKDAPEGQIPANVQYSFYVGAAVFIGAILWTIISTKEYSPAEREQMGYSVEDSVHDSLGSVFNYIKEMPQTMKQLGLVQFFSWFGLFSMWVFSTPAIAHHVYGLSMDDHSSSEYQTAGNWVGIIFGVYSAVSAIYAMFLPKIANLIGNKGTHAFSLIMGGIGLISIYFIKDPNLLIWSMVGVGMAWASILAMPYAILAGSIPFNKMGVYMGIFNLFITMPQIVNGIIGGPIVKHFYAGNAIYAIVMAGIFFIFGAISVLMIKEKTK
ncbi:MFS transporter [Sandaracinomonas limnophila]|uniref:MFS transporter n=1 Tax=Sandaracinomonas limnophila TaxID=1862386 RepID=A0A437PWM0_9BACT|nr:MFS transporter [Sandaracinomonas limnophila]RVU26651.1 MFS transporter [Sandaracinomonas limnophila]